MSEEDAIRKEKNCELDWWELLVMEKSDQVAASSAGLIQR